MIGNPAIVVGVEYSVTFSIGNLLACCQANTTVHNMKYGSFLVNMRSISPSPSQFPGRLTDGSVEFPGRPHALHPRQ
eukprot:5900324-Pyramimonas_sp.AAC.1